MIIADQPRAIGIDGPEPRLLRRQLHATVDPRQRTFVRDIADKRGKAVCTGSERADRHPATAVHVGERFVEAGVRVEARSDHVETAGGASETAERHRAFALRPPRHDRDRKVGAQVHGRALAGDDARACKGDVPLEAAAQPSRPFGRNADRAERREERNTAVRDVKHDVGELERLLRRRRQQLVDLAPANPAVHQPAAQTDATSDHAVDLEAAVPLQSHLNERVARDEVGAFGIADGEVADLLRTETDAVEMIASLHPAAFEFAFQKMRRDRPSLNPQNSDRDGKQDQGAEGGEFCNASPANPAHDDCRTGIVRHGTPLLVRPPLAHRDSLTHAAHDRSDTGMTLPFGGAVRLQARRSANRFHGSGMHGRVSGTSEADKGSGHRLRLRQRLLEGGPRGFHDYELLEYLLTLTIPRVDTKPLAKKLIDAFGGIGPLLSSSADTLRREGLGDATVAALKIAEATALRLLETRIEEQPLLSSWDALGDYLQATMAHRRTEEVRILFLNAKNMLIANEALWQGSVDEASVHVREVIARAIALGATALIIVHNHPSGDPTPSSQDIRLTRDLVEAGRHMKITVHDHVIVGARGRTSMRAMGLI